MAIECHRCSQKVEKVRTCEACKRAVCISCKDRHSNMCIDCKIELNQDPKKFYEYMNQEGFASAEGWDEDRLIDKDEPIEIDESEAGDYPYNTKDSPFEGEEGQEEYATQEGEYCQGEEEWEEKCAQEEYQQYIGEESHEEENSKSKLAQEEVQEEIGIGKKEIVRLSDKYYREHYEDWTAKEIELGGKIRKAQEINLEDLIEMNEWKFRKTNPDVWEENLHRIMKNSDPEVRKATRQAFLELKSDEEKIRRLYMYGVGNSLASVILSFYNPREYGVFDKHVWQELFGQMPQDPYKFSGNPYYYMNILTRLRYEARKYNLDVRTIEKAYFKKNFDNSAKSRKRRF